MKSHLSLSIALFIVTFFCCKPSTQAVIESEIEKIEAELVTPPMKNASIEYKTADWCGPCRAWKRSGAIAGLEKQGWTFKANDDLPGGYPSFRVWVNGRSETFVGYSTRSSYYKRIKSINSKLEN